MDRRHSTLFFERLFSPLNCVHAANHKSRKIALHNLFFARFFAAKHLPSNFGLPLSRGLIILRAYTGNCVIKRKGKSRTKHCN